MSKGFAEMSVRFFIFDEEVETESGDFGDIVECDESTFLEGVKGDGFKITYERHTVFENGVAQICLTASPEF